MTLSPEFVGGIVLDDLPEYGGVEMRLPDEFDMNDQSPEFVVALCLAICQDLDTSDSFELGNRL